MFGLDKFLLFVALAVVVLASLVEGLMVAQRGAYDWLATGVKLLDRALCIAIQIFLPLAMAAPLIALAFDNRLVGGGC